uniref:Uncharacterized protein n=1 Tax=Guillardia theta TaxID=55529 RepID=A0A7S4P1H0_GUITH|mmetsp:Transcript_4132/g.15228  ORF Transcript_4132/g.15228 Transcript_4132/m.15228 type:complete len:981 (+) Transcript_4132:78-3020(+)
MSKEAMEEMEQRMLQLRRRRAELMLELETRKKMIEIVNERMTADRDEDVRTSPAPALPPVPPPASSLDGEEDVVEGRKSESMLLLESGYDDSEQRKKREAQAKAAKDRLRALNEERWKIMERQKELEDKLKPLETEQFRAKAVEVVNLPQAVNAIGSTLSSLEENIEDMRKQLVATDVLLREAAEDEPPLLSSQTLTQDIVRSDEERWMELTEEINRRLQQEALERAMRNSLKSMLQTVIKGIARDVVADATFSHFWAARSSSNIIINALGRRRSENSEHHKQKLLKILEEFKDKRLSFQYTNVLSHPVLPSEEVKLLDDKKKRKKQKPEEEQKEETRQDETVLFLHSDLPAQPDDEEAIKRDKIYWSQVKLLPIYFNPDKSLNVLFAEPSPDSNKLAVVLVGSQVVKLFDVRHLPPVMIRSRAGWGVEIKELMWSKDSSCLLTLDHQSQVLLWSLRIDRIRGSCVEKGGRFSTPGMQQEHTFDPLVEVRGSGRARRMLAEELSSMFDVSDPNSFTATCVSLHSSITITGHQPSALMGLKGGMLVKLNSPKSSLAIFGACCAPPEIALSRGGGAVQRDAEVPKREYFVRHSQPVMYVSEFGHGEGVVSMDEGGLVVTWRYDRKSFSNLGWFLPSSAVKLNATHEVYVDDEGQEGSQTVLFTSTGSDMQARRRAGEEHEAKLRDLGVQGEPVETRSWKEGTLRQRVGEVRVYKGEQLDSESASFHLLKYDADGILVSHTSKKRTRQVITGRVLKAKIDVSGTLLVFMALMPPTSSSRPSLVIFKLDLRSSAFAPTQIEVEISDKSRKQVDVALKGGRLVGFDFDIAPPQGDSESQVVYVLAENKVMGFSLQTGMRILKPFEPRVLHRGRVLFERIRSVAKYSGMSIRSAPPTPEKLPGRHLPQEDEEPRVRRSYEHLIIITSSNSPVVYMYSAESRDSRMYRSTPLPRQREDGLATPSSAASLSAAASVASLASQTTQSSE